MRALVKALKRQYQAGNITIDELKVMMGMGKITQEELNYIIEQ